MEEVVKATGGDSGTTVSTEDDSYGYRWMVLRNPDGAPSVEDLAVGINAVSRARSRPPATASGCCARCSPSRTRKGSAIYFIYNYKRGYWYPFVPAAGASSERSTERELQLKAQMASELPIEPELERWFPLWGIPI